MEDKILNFKQIINESINIVFFGGAGVSTESGIPDFRSKDGLYNQKYKFPPETILSHTFFVNETEEFYEGATPQQIANSVGITVQKTLVLLRILEQEKKVIKFREYNQNYFRTP